MPSQEVIGGTPSDHLKLNLWRMTIRHGFISLRSSGSISAEIICSCNGTVAQTRAIPPE
jgi:hypothetical protein